MAKRLEIKTYDTLEELQREIKHAKDGRYQNRLRCILNKGDAKKQKAFKKVVSS